MDLGRGPLRRSGTAQTGGRSSTERFSQKPAPPVFTFSSDKLSEAEVIRRARDGDPAMFECLYQLHSRRVYAVCLRMLRDSTEAENLTQEAFMLVIRKIHAR
jgi:hypothetical protein